MLLALDTSTRVLGVALYDGSRVVSESSWQSLDHHTVELSPAITDALKRAGIGVKDLRALAVTTGPGSFTGMRIGLALAKGLALSCHIPLIGIPTLGVLAAAQPVSGNILVVALQVGRGRLAVCWYKPVEGEWQASSPASILTAEELSRKIQKPTLVCGELTPEEQQLLSRKRRNVQLVSPANSLRRPSFLAELAWKRWQSGKLDDPATLSPLYIHYNEPVPG